eukprot:TRINITY_DN2829_c0_g1_i2.p1 TRINITY_DN2829_c0_g1~~TRINITY_DN2829_c0_g1_i2.p1  ORF type:complete len:311 (-),score=44.25 TRINITY_DN2829_c0_g1_i2:260-1192(-)
MAGSLYLSKISQTDSALCHVQRNQYCGNGSSAIWLTAFLNSRNDSKIWRFLTTRNHSKQFGKAKLGKIGLNVRCSLYGSSGSSGDFGKQGDPRTQDLLVEMVRLEISKVQMRELLDKSSQKIQQIGLQTQLEYAQLADLTVKSFDASGSEVLDQLDANASVILDEFNLLNADLEAQSRNFEERQIIASYSRNEGLFFKNLYKAPRVLTYRSNISSSLAEKTAQLPSSITQEDFIRSYKQVLYGGLSLVFLSFVWSSSSAFASGASIRAWKLISYGIIMSLLLAQLAYAKELVGGFGSQKSNKKEKMEDDS